MARAVRAEQGALVSDTPEFESYKRTYEPLWPVIGPLISQLEALAKQVRVGAGNPTSA